MTKTKLPIIKPAALQHGDTVGLITPASFLNHYQFEQAVRNFEQLGFKVAYPATIMAQRGYLAGTDRQRANEINAMLSDKNIKAIFCARGGYGSARIVKMIKYKLITDNPKIFVGFSDITTLLHAIYRKAGLVCFHGPMGVSNFTSYTTQNFKRLLMNNAPSQIIKPFDGNAIDVIKAGAAEGILSGGNLSLLCSLVGTAYEINYKDKIIFIEEVGEEPYRIDRMLTHLINAGRLRKAKALILGNFHNCQSQNGDKNYSLKEVLKDRLSKLKIPVVYGFSFGHVDEHCILPVGVNASFDTTTNEIRLLENVVA